MAKVTAPLLSLGASGQIGDGLVFASTRGVDYVRQKVVPSNPRTVAQQLTRTTFAFMREIWKLTPPRAKVGFEAFAQGTKATGMNRFVGENLRLLRGSPNLAPFLASPGAKGGLAPNGVTIQSGAVSGEVDVDVILPEAPDGWLAESLIVMALPDQDPSGLFSGRIFVDEDTVNAESVTLTGMEAGTDYAVSAFLEWSKPDGRKAYSVATTDIVTATA